MCINKLVNFLIPSHHTLCLYPSITKPTRKAILIDNVITNICSKQILGIVLTDISDHLPIFISTNQNVYKSCETTVEIEIRDVNNKNIDILKDKLSEVDWDVVCTDDANVSYNNFYGQN